MKKVTVLLFLLPAFLLLFACRNKLKTQNSYQVRMDVRFGSKFFSIYVNDKGETFVVKGKGSNYTGRFTNTVTSDTSKVFKSDSLRVFFDKVKKMEAHPVIIESNVTDAARIEIYYKSKKVYDYYGFDSTFMSLFRDNMGQLPKGFNPFRADDHPFDYRFHLFPVFAGFLK